MSSGLLAAGILAALPLTASANTVSNRICYNNSEHCYATISQGSDRSVNPVNNTLTNLTRGTAVVKSSCMKEQNTHSFVNNEIWLVTSPNPSGPAYRSANWQPEWLEAGITSGVINGQYLGLSFFWARQYWQSGLYRYAEYWESGAPSLNTNYTMTIQSYSTYWRILRDGSVKEQPITQQPPGSHMALQAGAEMVSKYDKEYGTVTGLSYAMNGSTYTGWYGYVYRDPSVFVMTATGPNTLGFQTATCP